MKILLICMDEYIGRRVLRCLNWKRDAITVLSPDAIDPIRYSRLIKHHDTFDFSITSADITHRLEAFAEYADHNAFDIVIPSDVTSAKFLSEARGFMNSACAFPISDSVTLDVLDDKWSFAQLLQRMSIPHPKTVLLTNTSQIEELPISPPLAVKPLDERGSHGFAVFQTTSELSQYIASNAPYAQFPLIVQEFIPGHLICCNILAYQGEVLVSTTHKNYSDQESEFLENNDILDVINLIVKETAYTGVANFDIILNDQNKDFRVLECNPRFWNSLYASKWWGVDFAKLGIDLAFERISKQDFADVGQRGSRFCTSGFLVRRAIRKNTSWRIVRANLPNIWYTVSDPLPLMVDRLCSVLSTFGWLQ
ncbi:MAG: ATP-grasp domain-containing protein [Hyphomicrobiales bacterium]|nr:ATP-grasp domain-containing protein [Hyphomicrobiales bacterium]